MMKYLLNQILRLRPRDIPTIFKLLVMWIPGKLYRRRHPDVWVVTEYAENARDNGYWFFKYIRENYPEKEVYYPIKKKASDYTKVAELGNTIEFGGWKHSMLYWAAAKYIGTTKYHGFPDDRICGGFFELKLTRFKYIFLNHGFARGVSGIVSGESTRYDLIIAISELEKKIMVEMNHQDPKKIQAIGFCRHDNLFEKEKEPGLVVVMPTWRRWLDYRHETNKNRIAEIRKDFFQSPYYKEYSRMLNDPEFLEILERENLHLIFYLHGYAQGYAGCFKSPSDRVIIAEKEEYFVQDLLKKAAFLITDYSSVSCDYVYMKKPMVYYQFDAEEFSEKQYAESEYFTYKDQGFGPIATTLKEVEKELLEACRNEFAMKPEYERRTEAFFEYFGHQHCEKTYELVEKL